MAVLGPRVRARRAVYLYHGYDDLELQQSEVYVTPLHVQLENGGSVRFQVVPSRQVLERSFSPVPGVEIGRGDYDFLRYELSAGSDPSRKISVSSTLSTGGFYDGDLDTLSAGLTLSPNPRLLLSTSWQRNRLRDLGPDRAGRDTDLATAELRLARNPRLRLSTLRQYNTASEQLSWNARFSWEVRPLSYLYVVYDEIGTTAPGSGFLGRPDQADRRLVIKLSYLWQL